MGQRLTELRPDEPRSAHGRPKRDRPKPNNEPAQHHWNAKGLPTILNVEQIEVNVTNRAISERQGNTDLL